MAQGSESDVNRKGDMEKLMKHTEGVCTFILKIHWGKKTHSSLSLVISKLSHICICIYIDTHVLKAKNKEDSGGLYMEREEIYKRQR